MLDSYNLFVDHATGAQVEQKNMGMNLPIQHSTARAGDGGP